MRRINAAEEMAIVHHHIKIRGVRALLLGIGALLLQPFQAVAHEGPPYAIIVDKPAAQCLVSVWGDPDVGIGTFFVILEPLEGETLADDIKVEIGVQPVSGRLAEASYSAEREKTRSRVQFKAEVPFDAQELWRVRVLIESTQSSGEVAAEVEVTPPGLGRWDLLLYLFPFIAIGMLWLLAVIRSRNRKSAGS